jgi:hypothetical protein
MSEPAVNHVFNAFRIAQIRLYMRAYAEYPVLAGWVLADWNDTSRRQLTAAVVHVGRDLRDE